MCGGAIFFLTRGTAPDMRATAHVVRWQGDPMGRPAESTITLALLLALGAARSAPAVVVGGGGSHATDCIAVIDATGANVPPRPTRRATPTASTATPT